MLNRVLEIMEEDRIRESNNFKFLAELDNELEKIIQEYIAEEAIGQ